MERYEITIEGQTPLLMHHNNLVARDEIAARGRKGGKAGDDRTPPDMWKAGLYLDDKMGVCIPAENFLGALLKAGSKVSIGRMQTLKAASQSMMFDDFYIPVLVGGKRISKADIDNIQGTFAEQCDGAAALGFSLFVKPVGVNGKSHVRVRPRFDKWSCSTVIETDHDDLLAGVGRVEDVWAGAGKQGIGDWRPSAPKKPGMYGMFKATVKKFRGAAW